MVSDMFRKPMEMDYSVVEHYHGVNGRHKLRLYADAGVRTDARTELGQWAQLRYKSLTIFAGPNNSNEHS